MAKTYRVTGMSCGGCSKSVTNAIKELAPSAEVSVDLDAAQVTVVNLDDDALIAKAVDNAGFTFEGPVA